MRIFILSILLASCSAVVESEPVPSTLYPGGEEPGWLGEPTFSDSDPVFGASDPGAYRSDGTEPTVPDLAREPVPGIAMDHIAKIRDNTGAVPPPYVIRSEWEKRRLTYCLAGWTDDLTREELIDAVEAAAWVWMEESDLVLTRVVNCWSAGADIVIDFLDEDHSYYDAAFGSSSTVIAEADLPEEDYTLYLDLRDDDTIEWTTDYRYDGDSPIDVRTTLTHEFGHLLGLSHTDAECSGSIYPVMCPIYRRSIHVLASDDINGISASYGASLGYCQDGFVAVHIGHTSMAEAVEAMESLYAMYGSDSVVSTLKTWVDSAWYYTDKAYSYAEQTAISGPVYSAGASYNAYRAISYAGTAADYAYSVYGTTGSGDAANTQYRSEDAQATLEVAFDLMFQCYAEEYGDDPDF